MIAVGIAASVAFLLSVVSASVAVVRINADRLEYRERVELGALVEKVLELTQRVDSVERAAVLGRRR